MNKRKNVKLVLYRYAGKFIFFRIKAHCAECDISNAILQMLINDQLSGKPVTLKIVPWLDNFWKVIWRGGWHAPILTVNGKVFSQGIVLDIPKLLQRIGKILHDASLIQEGEGKVEKAQRPEFSLEVTVYYSPACPHCRQLISFLEDNRIEYSGYDVTKTKTARREVFRLTKRLSIPVIIIKGEIVEGFDRKRLSSIFGVTSQGERKPAVKEKKKTPQFTNRELRSLFRGQWNGGFLPHIIFNPDFINHFPGVDYWKAEKSGKVPSGAYTSGISQPPVHATMIVDSIRIDPEKERALSFLREIYPKLKALHDFYLAECDLYNESIVYIVHPWESGLDNAPLWDEPLAAIRATSRWALNMQRKYDELAEKGKRPKRTYIEKYSYLIENLFRNEYNWQKISKNHQFLIQDVLFNSVLCRSEHDLGKIAESIGLDPGIHYKRAEEMKRAVNKKLCDESDGIYYN